MVFAAIESASVDPHLPGSGLLFTTLTHVRQSRCVWKTLSFVLFQRDLTLQGFLI